ncbi:MAG: proton-conducting transporter membrane subunit [Chloroflexota bacterium]|nr:hypothetical protein [Chloroflexota bacterium]
MGLSIYDILLVLGTLLPLIAGTFFFFFGWIYDKHNWFYRLTIGGITLITLACQLGLAYGFGDVMRTPFVSLFKWSPLSDFEVTVAFRGDLLSFFFALPLVILTSLLIFYLLVRQPEPEHSADIERGRLYGLLLMAEGTGLAAFYAADLVMLYAWLEALGLCFYLLAGPGLHGVSSPKAAYRSYCASIFAGFAILAPLLVIVSRNGGISLYHQLSPATVDELLFTFVVLGVLVKASQFPFQIIFGKLKKLPAAAHALLSIGTLLPLAVYLPLRLQTIVADRIDLFKALGWLFLPVGALTIFCCGWLALRETALVQRTAYLATGAFGLVVIALGLGNLAAALWQLLGLSLAVPLLFLCADLLQIENDHAPPDPKNAARSIPIQRPALFRAVLTGFYLVGAAGVLGLPLSPAYTARWQTLSGMLEGGYRFYFGLAGTGLVLMMLGLVQGFALFLQEPHQTEDKMRKAAWWPLLSPALLVLVSVGLGFAPILALDWLSYSLNRIPSGGSLGLPKLFFGPGNLFGLLLLLGLAAGLAISWRMRKIHPAPAFNGGQLFGAEADAAEILRRSRNRALVLPQAEEAFGFEDEFFKIGLGDMAPPPPKVEMRLSPADYFGPLTDGLNKAYLLLDSSEGGNFFARLLLRMTGFIRRAIEWLTEKFYPALAAFILLIFIFLLTR